MTADVPAAPDTRGLTRRQLMRTGALATTTLAMPAVARGGARTRPPELVLLNGEVHTMDRRFSVAQALAVRNGRVVETGTTREIRRLAGRRTRVIDLEGRAALPGINDAHVHGLAAGISMPPLSLDVGFPTARSIRDIVEIVRQATQQTPPGTWIRGSGWNLALLEETRADPNRLPTRQDLDAVAPDHPVILRDFSFHSVWVNSRALQLAGVDRNTPTPEGGVIIRDAAGDPTGLLAETAVGLITRVVPPLSPEQLQGGLRRAIDVLLSFGITSYTDPGLAPDEIQVYRDALAGDGLRSRVTLMLSSAGSLTGAPGAGSVASLNRSLERYPRPRIFHPTLLRLIQVKIFADGIPPNHTAWLHEPYADVGGTGGLVISGATEEERAQEFLRMIERAHRAGYQVGTHATGDRTIDTAVIGYVRAMRRHRRRRGLRHYTIHSDLASDPTLRRMARNDLPANMNPAIKAQIADQMITVLGPERAARQWPMRSALRAGVTVTSASDWPVTPPDWRSGVAAAVLRQDVLSGNVSGPEERLSVRQALWTYTAAGAVQDRAERWKGSLTPGKVADICILDGRLPRSRSDVSRLTETAIAMTILGGDVVFEASGRNRRSAAVAAAAMAQGAGGSCAHGLACCCTRAPQLLAGHA